MLALTLPTKSNAPIKSTGVTKWDDVMELARSKFRCHRRNDGTASRLAFAYFFEWAIDNKISPIAAQKLLCDENFIADYRERAELYCASKLVCKPAPIFAERADVDARMEHIAEILKKLEESAAKNADNGSLRNKIISVAFGACIGLPLGLAKNFLYETLVKPFEPIAAGKLHDWGIKIPVDPSDTHDAVREPKKIKVHADNKVTPAIVRISGTASFYDESGQPHNLLNTDLYVLETARRGSEPQKPSFKNAWAVKMPAASLVAAV